MRAEGDPDQPPPLQLPRAGSLRPTPEEHRQQFREETRSWIAKALVLLLSVAALALIGLVGWHRINANDAISILAPLVAAVGTALGFYFGGHEKGP